MTMKTTWFQMFMFAILILAGKPAQAQDDCPYPYSETVDCATVPDDDLCTFQKQNKLTQSGRCDRATALALVGDNGRRYTAFQGSFPTAMEAQTFAICSATGPRRSDNKCGWFRIVAGDEAAPANTGSAEDPITIIARNLTGNAQATEAAVKKARLIEKSEVDYECRVNNVLGIPCLKLLVFGASAGATNNGWFTGGTLALHIPMGWYKSGLEIGVQGGYSGSQLNPGKVTLVASVGPVVQGVIMPWRRLGFVLGGQWDHRVPDNEIATPDFVGVRFGVRVYPAKWLALEVLGLSGGSRDDDANWSGAGGGQAGVLIHL